jgi:ectoine hydroxylase-related dioxygenase (phytanoyl-CoA dioxygenase family)
VTPFLGDDVALFSSHFLSKPGGTGKRVPWHEDSAYWKGWMEPMEVVTVWLAIDPSTRVNGCMKVIPRTHDNGYSDYEPVDPTKNVFDREIVKRQRDESKAVDIELQPNQASVHDCHIQHASEANTSPLRRCGYNMRYISTRTRFDSEKVPFQKIFLARGRDYAGNEYGDPTVSYIDLARTRTKHMKAGH